MSVVDDFLKFLESPEGCASIEEMIRRDKIIEDVENRWIEKYHNLFRGNLIKIDLGTPPQFIFSQIS